MTRSPSVLGCPVDLLNRADFLASLPALATGERLIDIVTLNPEQIMAARRDSAIAALLEQADIRTVDGIGLALALRAQGNAQVERVTGVDLVEELAARSIPLFLLGGSPGAAEESAQRLTSRLPGAMVSGAWSGGTPQVRDDVESLDRIARSGAKAVAVAYGAPAQTEWIERNRPALEQTGVRIAVGVGGTLDYLAGRVRRAPAPVRRSGLEWLFRLISEPWRWRRQLVLPVFAVLAATEAVQIRIRRG
jgi:N-acetylglucosaminyldiphosphoundecaprenol N-acetyl-beta-D-mannosaminyltransferase